MIIFRIKNSKENYEQLADLPAAVVRQNPGMSRKGFEPEVLRQG